MNNLKMQKIINLKLNGLREHGQDINQKKEKIKEVNSGVDLKKLLEISEKINNFPKEINIHKTIKNI